MRKLHLLSEVDENRQTATCVICGPDTPYRIVSIEYGNRQCSTKYDERMSNSCKKRRDQTAAKLGRPYVRHMIANKDLVAMRGNCKVCGPVDLVVHGKKGRVLCFNRWMSFPTTSGHGLGRGQATSLVVSVGVCQNPGCGDIVDGSGVGPNKGQVDHDHATGEIRGVLCAPCNLALGVTRDNIKILAGLIEYLKNPPMPMREK